MKKLIIVVTLLLTANCALGQISQSPNSVGLYLNPAATLVHGTIAPSPFPVTFYLCLTNTDYVGLTGFELSIRNTGEVFYLNADYAPGIGGVNFFDRPEFQIRFNSVLPPAPVMVLAEFQVLLFGAEDRFEFWVKSVDNGQAPNEYPIVFEGTSVEDEVIRSAGLSAALGEPCMILNGVGVVANESVSLGHVKALYR